MQMLFEPKTGRAELAGCAEDVSFLLSLGYTRKRIPAESVEAKSVEKKEPSSKKLKKENQSEN